MTKLQDLLRKGELTLSQLEKEHDVGIKRHPEYPNLVMFKYGITSNMGLEFIQDCRGIILDEAMNWNTVNFTFRKFFNIQEGHAAPIDWKTAKAYTKYDGSIIQMYHYAGKWHIATSGTPDAGSDAHGSGMSFSELVKKAWEHNKYKPLSDLLSDYCFAFELMTKWNKIVVQYGDVQRLVLIGVRDRLTGKEADPKIFAELLEVEPPVTYDLQTKDQVMTYVQDMSGLEGEGFVICDANYNRVKIKAPHYVALHQLKGEYFNAKRALEIVMKGEVDEVIGYFPEFENEIRDIEKRLNGLRENILQVWEANKHLENQKEFALAVKGNIFSGCLFAMKKGMTVDEYFKGARAESLLNWL